MPDEERPSIQVVIRATPSEALEFFEKLARDDGFRERLEKDPREVLREYHIELSGEGVPEYAELPPKEEVEHFLAEIGEPDEFGHVAIPLGWGWFAAALGAMPFVAADRREGDDAR